MFKLLIFSVIAFLVASTTGETTQIGSSFNRISVTAPSLVIPIADGCGPGRWRGPYGGCRGNPYARPPGGYYQTGGGNGCPVGYWRGPWGHCRNTPYHGRLPGGGWQ